MTKLLIREIDQLKRKILNLSSIVEDSVFQAVKSVETRDAQLAESVIRTDREIDTIEVEVEEDCLKILALHQPVAQDLRMLVAVLKMNNDLERIGDLAVNIAHRSIVLSKLKQVKEVFKFQDMTQGVRQMLKDSLESLVNQDAALAQRVCAADDDIDRLNSEMHLQLMEAIRANPGELEALLQLISVSRNLERVADHATNIAEDVIYMVNGEIVRHKIVAIK